MSYTSDRIVELSKQFQEKIKEAQTKEQEATQLRTEAFSLQERLDEMKKLQEVELQKDA